MAQVYSVNAVGYVNLTLPTGLSLIANPLNGTNNDLNTILPLPDSADGTVVYKFDVASQSFQTPVFFAGIGWFPSATLDPGEGFFIAPQLNGVPGPQSVTFVGEVPQGNLSNPVPGGNNLALRSSQVPQEARLGNAATVGTLLYPAVDGDTVFVYQNVGNFYDTWVYFDGIGWSLNGGGSPDGPLIPVASGFWTLKSGVAQAWTRTFSVN
jgi:hypothetical protein